jgi:hypothetical protein
MDNSEQFYKMLFPSSSLSTAVVKPLEYQFSGVVRNISSNLTKSAL